MFFLKIMENIDSLVKILKKYNKAYRNGKPLVSDLEYDRIIEKLRELAPYHPFLLSVEPEKFDAKKEVRHPVPMLSTKKTYTKDDLEKFIARVNKAAHDIGIRALVITGNGAFPLVADPLPAVHVVPLDEGKDLAHALGQQHLFQILVFTLKISPAEVHDPERAVCSIKKQAAEDVFVPNHSFN